MQGGEGPAHGHGPMFTYFAGVIYGIALAPARWQTHTSTLPAESPAEPANTRFCSL